MQVIPAIFEKDFIEAKDKIELIKNKSRWIQVDVSDGFFNPGKSFELELLNKLNLENNLIDIHLMVKEPIKWIEKCDFVGASRITGQIEMMTNKNDFVGKVKNKGIEAGLAFDVNSKVSKKIPDEVDLILLMGRKSGFETAEFDEKVFEKIKRLGELKKKNNFDFKIGIDGGVNLNNIEEIKKFGGEIIYCTKAIFDGNIDENLEKLKRYAGKN